MFLEIAGACIPVKYDIIRSKIKLLEQDLHDSRLIKHDVLGLKNSTSCGLATLHRLEEIQRFDKI